MLYDLRLKLSYAYETPVGSSRHLLRIFPRDIPGVQRAIVSYLEIDPPASERSMFVDAFGNQTQDILLREDHARLDILLTSRVERMPTPAPTTSGAALRDLPQDYETVRSLDAESPHHFLWESSRVRMGRRTNDIAREIVREEDGAIEVVRKVGEALHKALVFDSTATEVDTPLEEAFARGRGVCQDFTHIMIACLRGIGVPAGYVSGYLRTIAPPGQERLAGADAMHAWVRAWCGAAVGWVEYDPTNALWVGEQHVVAAYGRDYFDVAPIKGVLRTIGSHQASQAVDLIEVNAAA